MNCGGGAHRSVVVALCAASQLTEKTFGELFGTFVFKKLSKYVYQSLAVLCMGPTEGWEDLLDDEAIQQDVDASTYAQCKAMWAKKEGE